MFDTTGASCTDLGDAFFYGGGTIDSQPYVDGTGTGISGINTHYAYLRRICLKCPLVKECREWAINNEDYGFWGGLTQVELRSERVMRGIVLKDKSAILDELVLKMRQENEDKYNQEEL